MTERWRQESLVEVLLFDMGGVILDVDFNRVFEYWSTLGPLSVTEIRSRFRMDSAYQQHERGELSSGLYIEYLRETLQLAASDEAITAGWNAIFSKEFTEVLDAIDAIRPRYPCYGFTNSNALHQRCWEQDFPRIRRSFDHLFVSSEIGLRKPEPAAFRHILAHANVDARHMLFFDDSEENIRGAQTLNLQTVTVTDPEVVLKVLANLP